MRETAPRTGTSAHRIVPLEANSKFSVYSQ